MTPLKLSGVCWGGNRAWSARGHMPHEQMGDISLIERASQSRGEPSQHTRGPHRGCYTPSPIPHPELHTHAHPYTCSVHAHPAHTCSRSQPYCLLRGSLSCKVHPLLSLEPQGPEGRWETFTPWGAVPGRPPPRSPSARLGLRGSSQHVVPAFPQYFAEPAPAL